MTFPALSVTIASALSFAMIVAGHYFAWPRRLRRLEAYVFGVATIIAAFGVLAAMESPATTTWPVAGVGLLAIVGAAGAADLACYGFDSYMRMRNLLRERDADKR